MQDSREAVTSMATNDTSWSQAIGSEVDFWRSWFAEDKYAEARDAKRRLATSTFPEGFAPFVGLGPSEVLRVLDVGSGPISGLPSRAPDNPVELVCTDALADFYNTLLDEHGFDEVPRVLKIKGEELSSMLAEGRFHFVHIANALDHCEDPARTLEEMYKVCKPGGLIVVASFENEGERRQYHDLHQWNLEADDQSLWLWNPSMRKDLLEGIGDRSYAWCHLDQQEGDEAKFFRVEIRKL